MPDQKVLLRRAIRKYIDCEENGHKTLRIIFQEIGYIVIEEGKQEDQKISFEVSVR